MLGYLAGPRMGAVCYNIVHATPLAWVLGYGLKFQTGLEDTHLGKIGGA
jgi:Domain of unknown function (DUF4260)